MGTSDDGLKEHDSADGTLQSDQSNQHMHVAASSTCSRAQQRKAAECSSGPSFTGSICGWRGLGSLRGSFIPADNTSGA